MSATLLIELRCEELPPKSLPALAAEFRRGIVEGLAARGLGGASASAAADLLATPRRLAVVIDGVLASAPDASISTKVMPVAVALDAQSKPTPALVKKLAALGIAESAIGTFEKRLDGKTETFFHQATVQGARLDDVLATIVADTLKKLPIRKLMRWGDSDHQFVRPVHGLVMLHGGRVVPGEVLGLTSGNSTLGHRFLSDNAIVIADAGAYAGVLHEKGKVVASFTARRELIRAQLDAKARELKATINPADGLLDEVTALVEWPVVYVGEFEAEFLEVPQECLILTMQQNQKYFPLLAASGPGAGKLLNKFLIVSNMAVADARHIVTGNARVVRPRLADARFFFTQDRKQKLETRLAKLAKVVYHNKLGTQMQRVERLARLAQLIVSKARPGEVALASAAERAARLAKADLVTDMVGEFPELQGIMGRYYALADGESAAVADAIATHYRPRFAGDLLPQGDVATAVALADKLDALVGFFGIGQLPTGDKDPFALRRAALGVLRILIETPLALPLDELIADAAAGFTPGHAATALDAGFEAILFDFFLDRLRGYLRDDERFGGHAQDMIESVLAQRPARIDLVPARLAAVRAFAALPEAEALAAANKRIGNILRKAEGDAASWPARPDLAFLQEPAEKALFERVLHLAPAVESLVRQQDYAAALQALAGVRIEVDRFFDEVMVMADEPQLRANRLALLRALAAQMNAVADISRLAG